MWMLVVATAAVSSIITSVLYERKLDDFKNDMTGEFEDAILVLRDQGLLGDHTHVDDCGAACQHCDVCIAAGVV